MEAPDCAPGRGEIVEVLRVLGRFWKGLGERVRGEGYLSTHSEIFAILVKSKAIPVS